MRRRVEKAAERTVERRGGARGHTSTPASFEPRWIADIGARYAHFALERRSGIYDGQQKLSCADYPDFLTALHAYLAQEEVGEVRHAAIAIASPVEGDQVRMTNYPWHFSIEATRQAAGLETLVVVNDFTAMAMALPYLTPAQYRQIGGGQPKDRSAMGIVGAGSGFGVSGLIPVEDGWVALTSEGGHVSFSPRNAREMFILEYAWRQYPHVSAERLVSGTGLQLIYRALAARAGVQAETLTAPDIGQKGLAGACRICAEALEVFCEMLGTAAANVAVTLGAHGGLFIGGGVVPRLGTYFDRSGFRARFEEKGRFSKYVAHIPTYVITAERLAFAGASAILNAEIKRRSGASTVLERVRQARSGLSLAERRVADLVLSQPRSVLNDPIMEIARRAGVSQPTVVRFCRSLACEGLSDFKLKLASGLSSTIPASHTHIKRTDSTLQVGAKVLENTASALLKLRDHLNSKAVERAIEKLVRARRIELYAVGNYGVVAQDAQYKFLRLGVPAVAYTDARLQIMAAPALGVGDVVVAVSGSGRIGELLKAVDAALEHGAEVIAITPTHAPLAKRATVAIAIDHPEDVATHMPMISRILLLAVIDILAVGVAMRRPAAPQRYSTEAHEKEQDMELSLDFARITSHLG